MALVLVADDDQLVREVIQRTLQHYGHVVGCVASGEAAVGVASTKRPDLVILDCAMPGIGGVEALRRIRGSRETWQIPVLMLTGRRSDSDREIAINAGADHYLRKPFDPDEMAAIAERLMAKAAIRRRSGAAAG